MRFLNRSPSDRPWPRVVVVGAGFAGLWAAKTLARSQCSVLILDRNNYHTFLPLLYQVAAAELEPEQIAFPIRGIFRRHPNVDFAMTEVRGFDLTRRLVTTDTYSYPYDYLVLAAGSMTRFFSVPGAAEYAFRLKTLEQGIALRNQILSCVERADQTGDLDLQRQLLTFTVVGGGPTGIEYAGALSELLRRPLARDYPRLDLDAARIVLVEAQDGLLPGFPDNLRRYALRRLESKGVEVHTRAQVVTVTRDRVELQGREPIPTKTVVWTAGVKGQSVVAGTGLPVTPGNRLRVEPTLQLCGHPEAFAAGDLCAVQQDGHELPMIAPVAIQQGRTAAQNIMRLHRGRPPPAVSLPRQGDHGHPGPQCRGGPHGQTNFHGFSGLGALALRPPALPDRVQKPPHRAHHLGLGLLPGGTRRAPHPAQGPPLGKAAAAARRHGRCQREGHAQRAPTEVNLDLPESGRGTLHVPFFLALRPLSPPPK